MEWWNFLTLLLAGCVAGFINSMAGGGSLITLPVLMLAGLPPDVANGTNRIGILVQSITSYADYYRSGVRGFGRVYLLLLPLCLGAIVGAFTVDYVPNEAFDYIIIAVMLLAAGSMFVQPAKWAKTHGNVSGTFVQNPWVWGVLFLAGGYAGFIQVGVNFVILIIVVLWGNLDLLQANAFKQLAQLAFTLLVLPIFIYNGKVAWLPGIFLAVGSVAGSWIGSRLAVKKGTKLVRWLLCVAIVVFAIRQIVVRL